MSNCLNPLRLFEVDKDTRKVFGKEVNHVEVGYDGTIIPCKSIYINPDSHHAIFSYREIPCRTCYNCRKSHALKWSERVVAEMAYHDSAYFLTLTYNNKHLPRTEDGKMTINSSDLQKFWKRLRKSQKNKIKYFACSEYGSGFRPHYHAIVFGLELDDLELYSHDYEADTDLFISNYINDIWSVDGEAIGFATVGEANIATARYVAGYVDKKLKSNRSNYWYKQFGIEPEKLFISNGIGLQAYEDKIKEDLFDKNYNVSVFNGHQIHHNNYFASKYKESNPEEYENWTKTLERLEKGDRRARRELMPDSVHYSNMDRQNKYLIDKMQKRGD